MNGIGLIPPDGPRLYVQPALKPTDCREETIRKALQTAIRLEHAVIPPYLYALYSLDPVLNPEISSLIRSVVTEEMLHMALACNLLNAVGGHPEIDRPDFLMAYPGTLPGMVMSGPLAVEVHLAPFSIDVVRSTFMAIERPENPIPYALSFTVGAFYGAIRAQIEAAGPGIFSGDRALQITGGLPRLAGVYDLHSANGAIETIREQGEGTEAFPTGPGGALAHYYRFEEIARGLHLVPNPAATPQSPPQDRYKFDDPPVSFDREGVRRVPVDPRASDYPRGTAERRAIDGFNYTYTSLLKALHTLANGKPDRLADAVGLMFSLEEQAVGMMAGDTVRGVHLGPTFEYLPFDQ